MEYLKEDGSLDVERIKNLPLEEYMDAMGNLTQEQVKEYVSTLPVEKTYERMPPKVVDVEDMGVPADEVLNKLRESLGIEEEQTEPMDEEISEEQNPSEPEEWLHVTIGPLNRPEATMWAVVSKREWKEAKTLTDRFILMEKASMGQTLEETIEEIQKFSNGNVEIVMSTMERTRNKTDVYSHEEINSRCERLEKRIEEIRKSQKEHMQGMVEHRLRIVAKLEELHESGLLEITEEPTDVEGYMPTWDFINAVNRMLGLL